MTPRGLSQSASKAAWPWTGSNATDWRSVPQRSKKESVRLFDVSLYPRQGRVGTTCPLPHHRLSSSCMADQKKNYLIDMDGVLVRGREMVPGANAFIGRPKEHSLEFLDLTNNPQYTQKDLSYRLESIGLDVEPRRIFTSAMATTSFLKSQKGSGKVFVIGKAGSPDPLHDAGFIITDIEPSYVVLGETSEYNIHNITTAIRLIQRGARFIATNPDASGPGDEGSFPPAGPWPPSSEGHRRDPVLHRKPIPS